MIAALYSVLLHRDDNLENTLRQQRDVLDLGLDVFFYLGLLAAYGDQHIPISTCLSHLLR